MIGLKYQVTIPILKPWTDKVVGLVRLGLYRAGWRVQELWVAKAGQKLTTSYAMYIRGLTTPDTVKELEPRRYVLSVVVGLRDKVAQKFETGFPVFDMKPGFLRSPKAKTSIKGIKYLTIFLPIRAPGKGAGTALGVKAIIPPDVYKRLTGFETPSDIAQRLRNVTLPRGITPAELKKIHTRYLRGQPYGRWGVFRRASTRSLPTSWIHPGFVGARIVPELIPSVGQIAKQSIDEVFREAGI